MAVNFLDVEIILKNRVLPNDLSVKPTDKHQFLDPTFCHPYQCQKGIPYSQTVRLAPMILTLISDVTSCNVGCLKKVTFRYFIESIKIYMQS